MTKLFTEDTLSEALETGKLTVVDFFTVTCGPCRRLAPTIDKLAEEYGDTVNIGKCNVHENMGLATEYRISAVPTLVFLKNDQEVERHMGVLTEDTLRKLVEKHK